MVYSVLQARPNLNLMGASKMRRGGQRGGGRRWQQWRRQSDARVCRDGNRTLESLYPRDRNCQAFVTSPNSAAVLDVLSPPYNKEDGRECRYNQRRAITKEDDWGDGERQQPLITLVLVDRPDNINCLGGLSGHFCSDQGIDCVQMINEDINKSELCT